MLFPYLTAIAVGVLMWELVDLAILTMGKTRRSGAVGERIVVIVVMAVLIFGVLSFPYSDPSSFSLKVDSLSSFAMMFQPAIDNFERVPAGQRTTLVVAGMVLGVIGSAPSRRRDDEPVGD